MFQNGEKMFQKCFRNGEKCFKKVLPDGDRWRCEKCDFGYPSCNPRFIGKVKIIDHTGEAWCTISNQVVAEKVVGKTAIEVKDCVEGDGADDDYFKEYLKSRALGDWYFGVLAKQEFYNGAYQEKYYLFSSEKPEENGNKCCKLLLENIMAYSKFDS